MKHTHDGVTHTPTAFFFEISWAIRGIGRSSQAWGCDIRVEVSRTEPQEIQRSRHLLHCSGDGSGVINKVLLFVYLENTPMCKSSFLHLFGVDCNPPRLGIM